MSIGLEKMNSTASEFAGVLNRYLISRLDFRLPEDYKGRCPIFCTRPQAFQADIREKDWCAGRL
jgi:hypothetical protein